MIKHVTYKNGPITMAGDLYLPEGFSETGKYPAIICTHAAGAVKEQTTAIYAAKLAAKGFIALAFDASHQGASGGEPRFLEDPARRVEDIRATVDYLATLDFVDLDRVGVLGVCGGGGYSIAAAATERRIKAVGGISITDPGMAIREGWDGNQPVEVQLAMLEMCAAQRTAEARGAEAVFMPYVPEDTKEGDMVLMREAANYYRTPRGCHPNSQNKVMATALDRVMGFSAFDRIGTLLTQPLLLIVGSESDTKLFSQRGVEKAASKNKELFEVPGATHVSLYDIEKDVNCAVDKLAEFYGANL